MVVKTKTHTTLEERFVESVARGFWIGPEIIDDCRLMVITTIGKAYMKQNQWVIDFEATEIERDAKKHQNMPRPLRIPRMGETHNS